MLSIDPNPAPPPPDPRVCPLPADHPRRWTQARQLLFVKMLGATGCVSTAAAHAGMSRESAYRLRRRGRAGAAFARAWDMALEQAAEVLDDTAVSRALNGSTEYLFGREAGITTIEAASDQMLIHMMDRAAARRTATHRSFGAPRDPTVTRPEGDGTRTP